MALRPEKIRIPSIIRREARASDDIDHQTRRYYLDDRAMVEPTIPRRPDTPPVRRETPATIIRRSATQEKFEDFRLIDHILARTTNEESQCAAYVMLLASKMINDYNFEIPDSLREGDISDFNMTEKNLHDLSEIMSDRRYQYYDDIKILKEKKLPIELTVNQAQIQSFGFGSENLGKYKSIKDAMGGIIAVAKHKHPSCIILDIRFPTHGLTYDDDAPAGHMLAFNISKSGELMLFEPNMGFISLGHSDDKDFNHKVNSMIATYSTLPGLTNMDYVRMTAVLPPPAPELNFLDHHIKDHSHGHDEVEEKIDYGFDI